MFERLVRQLVCCGLLAAGACAWAQATHTRDPLDRAEALVDAYYGDTALLTEAARLVGPSLDSAPSARGFTLAARIVVKGGHIVSKQFQPGTTQLYRRLIDRALALDPHYAPALALLSESERIAGNVDAACKAAKDGVAADPKFAWNHIELAECAIELNDVHSLMNEIGIVIDAGPAGGGNQRGAYIEALLMHARQSARPQFITLVRRIATQVDEARDPKDAWALGDIAQAFQGIPDYDDAIVYAQKALSVMDYGLGHCILAAAYYGKAAQLQWAHADYTTALAKARSANGSPECVRRRFEWSGAPDDIAKLAPLVRSMLDAGRR